MNEFQKIREVVVLFNLTDWAPFFIQTNLGRGKSKWLLKAVTFDYQKLLLLKFGGFVTPYSLMLKMEEIKSGATVFVKKDRLKKYGRLKKGRKEF